MVAFHSQGAWRTSQNNPEFLIPEWEREVSASVPLCIHRHLAVAATQLARAEGLAPEDAARYAVLAARFRALVEREGDLRNFVPLAAPIVETDSGTTIALADLMMDRCPREPFHLPLRSIDPELVYEASELLRAHPWRLPDVPAASCR